MNKRKLTLAGLLLSTAVMVASPLSAFAATQTVSVSTQSVKMNFDGQDLALPTGQKPFLYQSRFYVPLRFSSYALLKNVDWNNKTKTVTVSEPSSSQLVVLKEYVMNAAAVAKANAGKTVVTTPIKLTPVTAKFVFDGTVKKLPEGQQAFSLNGTIYVPVRFMSESVGTVINWDMKSNSVVAQSSSNQSGSNGDGTGSNTGGNTSPGSGNGSGSPAAKTKDQITSQAQSDLETMRDSCINAMLALFGQYGGDKDELVSKANAQLASCQTNFEAKMTDTRTQLQAIGVSDADIHTILQGFRDTYNAEIAKYKKMAEDYLGIKLD